MSKDHHRLNTIVADFVCGLGKYVTCHISEFFPFFFLFVFFQHEPRSHFLTDLDDLYAKTRAYGQ